MVKQINKMIIFSTDILDDICKADASYKNFINLMEYITSNGGVIIFTANKTNKFSSFKVRHPSIDNIDNLYFKNRTDISKVLDIFSKKYNKNKYVIVIGNKDHDFYLAVNNKLMFYYPKWTKQIQKNVKKYGTPIGSVDVLKKVIKTSSNHTAWYAYKTLPDGSKVLSLMDAAYKCYSNSEDEKYLIKNFENVLKFGNNHTFFEILLFHFLSAISNNNDTFNDVDYWCIFPSSKCEFNKEMLEFKEKVRYMMKSKEPNSNSSPSDRNILIRHKEVNKSQYTKKEVRILEKSTKHLDSIHLNPIYREKINGKIVCVFDDFLNYGNSLESARNLLYKAGAEKVVLVTLGKFRNNYIYQQYDISGDVFKPKFTYNLKQSEFIEHNSFKINNQAKKEIENLNNIFNDKNVMI